MRKQKITVSVIGGHDADPTLEELARQVGKVVAESGAILVCGGLDGVMKAACRGAKESGGMTVGILPGKEKSDANPHVDVALPTSIGYARNAIVACSADLIVALPGSHGTRSEISYGLVYKRPLIDLGNWNVDGMIKAKDVEDAKRIIKGEIDKLNHQGDI